MAIDKQKYLLDRVKAVAEEAIQRFSTEAHKDIPKQLEHPVRDEAFFLKTFPKTKDYFDAMRTRAGRNAKNYGYVDYYDPNFDRDYNANEVIRGKALKAAEKVVSDYRAKVYTLLRETTDSIVLGNADLVSLESFVKALASLR